MFAAAIVREVLGAYVAALAALNEESPAETVVIMPLALATPT